MTCISLINHLSCPLQIIDIIRHKTFLNCLNNMQQAHHNIQLKTVQQKLTIMKALDNQVWNCLQIIYMQKQEIRYLHAEARNQIFTCRSKKLDIYMQKQEIRYLHAEARNQIFTCRSKKLDIYMQKQEIRYLHVEARNGIFTCRSKKLDIYMQK